MFYIEKCFQEKTIHSEFDHILIRLNDGRLMSIYNTDYGDDYTDEVVFCEIRKLSHDISRMVCGYDYVVILLRDGKIMSYGSPYSGMLKNTMFEEIQSLPKNVSDVYCGGYNAMVLLYDGRVLLVGGMTMEN